MSLLVFLNKMFRVKSFLVPLVTTPPPSLFAGATAFTTLNPATTTTTSPVSESEPSAAHSELTSGQSYSSSPPDQQAPRTYFPETFLWQLNFVPWVAVVCWWENTMEFSFHLANQDSGTKDFMKSYFVIWTDGDIVVIKSVRSDFTMQKRYWLFDGLLNLIRPDSRSKQPKNRRRLFLRGFATFRYFFLLLNLEAWNLACVCKIEIP